MDELLDEGIKILYAIIRQNEDAEAGEDQKEAARQIKRLAVSGNSEAVVVLNRLRHTPDMHPFLKEILHA